MRINAHAHIFNLQSVFTRETARILLRRLKLSKMPTELRSILEEQLEDFLTRTVTREEIIEKITERVNAAEQLGAVLKKVDIEGQNLDVAVNGVLAKVGDTLSALLWEKLRDLYDHDDDGALNQTWFDYIAFLRLALQPSITNVTDITMDQLGGEDGLIALMMDITDGTDDDKLFLQQLNDTSDMVLAYPGRLFPFVKVNTIRANHFTHMKTALETKGFWGVKLYTSLGYRPDSNEMFEVYKYCESKGVPLLAHCNLGGFSKDEQSIRLADPALWRDILIRHPDLKICFGHFGGDRSLVQEAIPQDCWTQTIVDLMQDERFSGVYADLSFHADPILGSEDLSIPQEVAEENYFRNVKALLAKPRIRDRLLFGTDSWLVRAVCREDDYWNYFEQRLSVPEFRRVAETNPAGYLGLPESRSPAVWVTAQHVRFFDSKKMRVQREPATWLKKAVTKEFGASKAFVVFGAGPTWSRSDVIHKVLFGYLFAKEILPMDKEPKQAYEQYGRFKLFDLRYWASSAEPDAFKTEIRSFANALDRHFMKYDIDYNEANEISSKKARKQLRAAFGNGALYLYELAALCNQLYTYEFEPEA